MSTTWTIGGKSFATLELQNLRRSLVSQGVDTVTFTAPGAAFDGEALFDYREPVTIKRGAVNWFKGIVRTLPRMGGPSDERIDYEIAGPWWHLEHTVYQQNWMLWNEDKLPDPGLELLYKSRVILNQDEDGDPITAGAQITAALNFAIEKGAPISVGAITPTIQLPFDEQIDITVADLIIRTLKFLPDYTAYFDYSAAVPAFNIVSRAAAAPKTYNVSGGDPVHEVAITAREDLKLPGVICRFEQTNSIDGASYESTTVQEAGTTDDYETLVATIALGGFRASFLTQEIVVEAIPDPLANLTWIQGHDPWFKIFANPADVQIVQVTRNGALELGNILVEGQLHDWIDVDSETEEFTVEALCDIKAAGNLIRQELVQRKFKVTTTDATSKTYRSLDSFEGGESIPEGLAAALYAAWGQLQYDGKFVLLEDECTSQVRPGHVLNLTGGVGAWASMRALIQSVTEEIDQGKTTITFGPARQIGVDDLVTLMRGFRTRKVSLGPKIRSTGNSDDAGNVAALGGKPGVQNVVAGGPGQINKLVLKAVNAVEGVDITQSINLDPTLISKDDDDVEMKPRELYMINETLASIQKRQVMASAGYDAAVSITQISVITDVRYDATSKQLQKKTRTAKVIAPGAESGWTLITGGQAEECDCGGA